MKQTIPAGWEEKTLGEVCTFLNGFAFEGKKLKNIKDKNNNIPVIKIGNLKPNETVSLKESQYAHYDNSLSNFLIKKNDILFAMSGATVGKVSLFLSEEKALLNQRVGLIRLNEERISLKFLLYQLFDKNFYNYCQIISGGTAQPNISLKSAAYYQIKYPSLPEQERIVEKLDKAFAAIDKLKADAEQNLTNAKELFESYLNNIFSNINASFNKKLSDVTKIVGGGTPSKSTPTYYQGNIPWATVRDMNEDDLSKTEFSITNEAVRSSATNIIPANNVIIATRVGLGKVCILMQDTAINQDLKGIIPTKPMNFKYLFWWFKSIKNKIEETGVGATVKGVKLPFVQNLQIPYISINDQQKIVEKLDAMQEQTKQLEQIYTQKIKECDELKQSILQKAFKGEL